VLLNVKIMDWIKRKLGITELIEARKQTNKLLEEVIRLQKHNINNDCKVHSRKIYAY
jgi:hypothetical protein